MASLVDWLHFCKTVTNTSDFVLEQEAGAASQQLMQAATALEAHMAGRTYVAGQQLSLADLVLAAELKPAFEQVQHAASCSNQSRWTVLCETAVSLACCPCKFTQHCNVLL